MDLRRSFLGLSAVLVVLAACAVPALAGNDLRVSMRMTPKSPKPGGKVTYLVSVTHMGTSFMKNMLVEDIVPAEITDVQVVGPPEVRLSAVTPESWGTRYTWSTPGDTIQMGTGVTYSFTITGRVAQLLVPTTVTNTVFIYSVNVCGSCGAVETYAGPAVFKVRQPAKKVAARAPAAKAPAAKAPAAKAPAAPKASVKKPAVRKPAAKGSVKKG